VVKTDPKKKSWTNRKERLLCEMWENHPLLYDREQNRKNSEGRKQIIEKIATDIDMTGKKLINFIKN
jgi:hypothetical protein